MATTKMWAVRSRLDHLVAYVSNTEKTENPDFMDLQSVIEYAGAEHKTEKRYYVSGVNCAPETAYAAMSDSLKRNDKKIRVLAYHGYQSFAEGEVTAETAHEIGLRLARELWGEKFQVVVATHLNTGHYHNHFVLCSTSFIDGRRFHACKESYAQMRQASDRLCREYELSVIEQPKVGRTKHYGEIQAERDGRPTWRGLLKAEIDEAISQSMTENQLVMNLQKRGYRVKLRGRDISVCPPGKTDIAQHYFRLGRNFGEAYYREGIIKQMRNQGRPKFPEPEPKKKTVAMKLKGNLKTAPKLTGFRALYFHYLYLLGKLPKNRPRPPNKVHFLYREDLVKIDRISKEITLLCRHHIDTVQQLSSFKAGLEGELKSLGEQRQGLRNSIRRPKNETAVTEVKAQISLLSTRMSAVRKEVSLCADIAARSEQIKEKMARVRQEQTQNQNQEKRRETRYEQFR